MMRAVLSWVVLVSLGLCASAHAGAPRRKPYVDEQAMREAMSSAGEVEEDFASSASYAHYLRSRLHHFQGEHPQALDELRLALVSDEDNPFLRVSVAEEYARMSDLVRAERELRRVLDVRPDYQPAQLMMGRVLMESRKFTRARVHLRRAIKLAPKELDGYLALAQLFLEAGQLDEATKVVDELAVAVPGEPIALKRLGFAMAERGEPARAEKLLRRAADRDPTDSETWAMLARLHEAAGRGEQAQEAYAQALQREPDDRELLLGAARLALKSSDEPLAKAYFDSLLAQTEEPELWVKVAFSYLASRRLERAAEVLDMARARSTGEPRLSFYAGLVHEKLRRYERAAEAYGEVPSQSELFHEARLHRAMCLSSAGRHGPALQLFHAAIADRPDYQLLYPAYARALEQAGQVREAEQLLLGRLERSPQPELWEAISQLYHRHGRAADAVALLTSAVATNPRDESLLFALGAAYERKGDFERCLEKMRAVLAVNPDNAAALNFIGYTLADRNRDIDEAERLVTRALQLRPDEGAYLDSLGWVYFRRGDFTRAVSTLERAAQLSPDEPVIIDHLGDAYRGADRHDDAQRAWSRALELLDGSAEKSHELRRQRGELLKKLRTLHAGP